MKRSAIRTVSLFLRRSHMYVALFLTPWMAMYALSTLVFNHFDRFAKMYGGQMDRFVKEREVPYARAFPAGAGPREIGEQVLKDLDLAGSFRAERPKAEEDDEEEKAADGRVVIDRMDPLAPRRISYLPAEKKVLVEKQVFRTPGFLTRLHSRAGYGSKYHAANVWAIGVDLSIAGTLLWILSGFWMWWELKVTRRWGIICALGGVALFGLFAALA